MLSITNKVEDVFSHFWTESPLPLYLPVAWEPLSVLLKDTLRRSWGSNHGPLAPKSEALPLSHRAPMLRSTT